ncbi:MAG: tetratricopeptide repeat protein [Chloroflexi bacterium]|nr:tetratricopeptide repeat protein [Chloroflexota bacterium]
MTKQSTSSFDERIEILVQELELAIKWRRPCVLLVAYSSEYVRMDVETAIENHLIDLGHKTVSLKIKGENPAQIVEFVNGADETADAVLFIDGLRWGHGKDTSIYEILNYQKELFTEKRLRVVLWLTQNEILDLAHLAPDFWVRRHCAVEFSESPKAERILQGTLESAWQGVGEYADLLGDTDAKISLRETLLTELPEEEEASFSRANLLLTLGILNWRKGDYEKAGGQLREALDIASKIQDNWFEAECFNAIALVETSLNRFDEAIDAYKQAIRLAPEQIFAWNNLGNLCLKIDRNDEAIVAYQKAVECNPSDPIGWNGLGNVYSKIGYLDDAVAAYRKSIQAMPSLAHPWTGLGDVYAGMSRFDEAVKAYHEAVKINQNYITPWLRLGALFDRQDRYRDSIKAYQRALMLDRRNSAVWNEMGMVHLKFKALGEAQDAFSKALEFNHGDGLALSNLAFAYSQQGKGRESIPLFYKSIALLSESRDKAVAWNRLGNVYRELNEYEDAVAAYQMADMVEHGKTPLLSPGLENTSVFQNENGSAAVQDCELPVETIESITADSPYWIFNPALNTGINKSPASDVQAYARPDAEEDHVPGLNEAVEKEKGVVMQESLAANPLPASLRPALQINLDEEMIDIQAESTNAHVWNEKGNVHFKQENFDEAIRAYNKAIQIDPAFGWPYSNLALVYFTQGQYTEAILLYQRSVELLSSNKEKALSLNGLGNVYRRMNDYGNAVIAYRKAAELDADTAGMRDTADHSQVDEGLKTAQAWNELGELFFKTRSFDEAAGAFLKAIELEPETGAAYSNMGRILTFQGRFPEAAQFLEKSIELFQDDKEKSTALNRLGNVYRRLNNHDAAVKAYQQAMILADEGVSLLTRARFSLLSNCYGNP